MADKQTVSTLKRRARIKIAGFAFSGLMLGLVLRATFSFEPVEAFLILIEKVTSWAPGVKVWLDANPVFRGWIAGPAALALLFIGLTGLKSFRRGVLDRLFPDPPAFVRSSLAEARHREQMLSLEGPPLPFVGRDAELAELESLLESHSDPFRWRALTGPSGMGKTRLGIEWLERAKARGWDIGVVDKNGDGGGRSLPAILADWRPRRPTALIVDEARRDWGPELGPMLAALAAGASATRCVRVIVIDQVNPYPDIHEGEARARMRSAQTTPSLCLLPMADGEIGALRTASGHDRLPEAVVLEESAGRPRAALVLMNARDASSYGDALSEWVERYVPGIGDPAVALSPALAGPLILSALAGPIATDEARGIFGPFPIEPLVRFYPIADPGDLELTLPKIVPGDLAREMLLRLLPRLDLRLREETIERMISISTESVETCLADLWSIYADVSEDEGGERIRTLEWLQTRFDNAQPDRVSAVRERVREIANSGREAPIPPDAYDHGVSELIDLVRARPFDPFVRRCEAHALVNFGMRFGDMHRLSDVEKLLIRLENLANDPRFSDFDEIMICRARGISNAICTYSQANQPAGAKLCASRLAAIVDDPRFAEEPEMREIEAAGAALVIVGCGASGDQEQIDEWMERVEALADDPRFNGNADIMIEVAKAAMNATSICERHGTEATLVKWFRLVAKIADREEFRDLEIMKSLKIQANVNSMLYYGNLHDFDKMEQFGEELINTIEDPRLEGNVEIRLFGVRGASNSINCYRNVWEIQIRNVDTQKISHAIARWGKPVLAAAHDARFAESEPLLHEISVALINATDACDHLDDKAVAFWGRELTAFRKKTEAVVSSRIWLNVARAIVNMMRASGRAARFKEMGDWGKQLNDIMSRPEFSSDSEFAEVAASGAMNSMVNLLNARCGDWPAYTYWRRYFARLALRFPGHPQIQEWGNLVGLSALDQRRNGLPFGGG